MSMGCGEAVPSTFEVETLSSPEVDSGRPAAIAASRVLSGPISSFICAYTTFTESAVALSTVMFPKLSPA